MTENEQLINRFYSAFAARDIETMVACYADDICFSDPVFPDLRGEHARNMWRMLSQRSQDLKVVFSQVSANDTTGQAYWVATYHFAKTGRLVENRIQARFEIRGGRITRHRDSFSFWRWSRQALGVAGWVLGATPILKNKVRSQAAAGLAAYEAKSSTR